MKIVRRSLFIILVILGACIDPLDVNTEEEINVLIVEGAITSKPGPHFIKLAFSARYGSIFQGYVKPATGANVVVRDANGNNVFLNEVKDAPGVYATPAEFKVEAGNNYTLLISTTSGNEYTSLPEKVYKAAPLAGLNAEYKKIPLTENTFSSGLNVLATFTDDPQEQNFYMWRSTGTYKIRTFPENYEAPGPGYNPAPKDCCKFCWVEETNGDPTIRLLADNNVNGNQITDVAAYIEDDGLRYYEKYLIRVEQHSLSREAFQFFKLLKDQLNINGDIFDPPPATLRGNMVNLTNPDENVIGYFRVSDVSIDSIFLTKDMLLDASPLREVNDDCRLYKNGSTQEPVYW